MAVKVNHRPCKPEFAFADVGQGHFQVRPKAVSVSCVAVGITPFLWRSLIRMTPSRWAGMLRCVMDCTARQRGSASLSEEHKERLMKNLGLARQLGAEIIHRVGDDLAQVIIEVANKENVTQIIVGKSVEKSWQRLLGIPTLADRLVSLSGQIDVHMVRMSTVDKNFPDKPKRFLSKLRPHEYGLSFVMFTIATVINIFIGTCGRLSTDGADIFVNGCFKRCFPR